MLKLKVRLKPDATCVRGACAVALLLIASAASAQKTLTLDDIFDPDKRVKFSGNPVTGLEWVDANHYAWPREVTEETVDWQLVDAVTGNVQPLFDASTMENTLRRLAGVTAGEAHGLAHSRGLAFSPTHASALFTIGDDLYVYAFADDRAVRLTYVPGAEENASFSPDGKLVAFVRHNDLFVVDVAMRRESALTTDGSAKILNGQLDWVYEEEIFGRGNHQAYWWSPDSSRIAYLRIDDTPVPGFTIVDHIPYDVGVDQIDYPKAGDPNPIVKIGVAAVTGGTEWLDTSKYSAADHLIATVTWTPDSRHVVFGVENRLQTWLDLNDGDPVSGTSRTILRETTKGWVEPPVAAPVWLKDGTFIWLSERNGWKHAYHYKRDGTLIGAVTGGRWTVDTLHGVDENAGWAYFSATEHSPIGVDEYRIKLDGTGLQRLSRTDGTHHADYSPAWTFYIDTWSDATTPWMVRLHTSDGSEVRVIDANHVAALGDYRLSKPEFLQVKTRDGFAMEAEMIKPPDFNPSRRYPVYQFIYGGPHAPVVANSWGGREQMYHQLLAQMGVIVWMCDNRSASGKGMEPTWAIAGHLGELELRDIEDGISWLKQQPYVDGTRIGIHGWSYGGFMTSYALTHSTSFVMGIAGGTVADWRDYDTVYTERYMGLPQDNPDGYRKSSPRWSASQLHGALMLIHGTIDDNVHMQNTLQFAYELQKAGKPFELMLYPKTRHGPSDPVLIKHLRQTMLAFVVQQLKPGQ